MNRNRTCIFFYIIIVFGTLGGFGSLLAAEGAVRKGTSVPADTEISATILPEPARLTDELTMTITAIHPPTLQLEQPKLGEVYGDFQITDTVFPPDSIEKDRRTSRFEYKLRPQKSGTLELPPIPLFFVQEGKVVANALLPAGKLNILSDHDQQSVSLNSMKEFFGSFHQVSRKTILLAILVLALVLALVYWLRHRQTQKMRQETERILSPGERALTELDALMASRVHEQDVRTFYLKITGIVRWFIEETTGIRAPEQTTGEFLHELSSRRGESRPFGDSLRDRLKRFLEFSDLVKFAKFQPNRDEIEDAYQSARIVIETPTDQTVLATPEPNLAMKEEVQR